jgi:hypothetical protein
VGNQSHPVEPGRQPEASLASAAPQGRRRSVDSQCSGRAIEPREQYPREPLACLVTGAVPIRRNGLADSVSPGSKNTASAHQGSPGTWDALRLHLDNVWRKGTANPKVSGPQAAVGGPAWSEHSRRGMVSPSEAQRSAATRSAGNRSASWYRRGRGTQPAGTRWRDGGAELRNCWEETWPVLRNRIACQRNNSG